MCTTEIALYLLAEYPGLTSKGFNMGSCGVAVTVVRARNSSLSSRLSSKGSIAASGATSMVSLGKLTLQVPTAIFATVFLSVPLVNAQQVPPYNSTADLIISEIMINPKDVPKSNGTWFELYNPSDQPYDLSANSIVVVAFVSLDDGFLLVDVGLGAGLFIPAKGYFVVGNDKNTATNGNVTVDFALGFQNLSVSETGGGIVVFGQLNDVACAVVWGTDLDIADTGKRITGANLTNPPFVPGASMSFRNVSKKILVGSTITVEDWCVPSSSYGSGGNKGTPKAVNDCILAPTKAPTKRPTRVPTKAPTKTQTKAPTKAPTLETPKAPTVRDATKAPTKAPTTRDTTKAPIVAPFAAPFSPPANVPSVSAPTNPMPAPLAAPDSPTAAAPVSPTAAAPVSPTAAAPVLPTVAAPVSPTAAAPVSPTVAAPVSPTVAAPVAPTAAAPVSPTVAAPTVSAPALAPMSAPTKKTPTKKKCGLFGLRVFCPRTACGIVGRILGACKK
jgi:hypothetical protein